MQQSRETIFSTLWDRIEQLRQPDLFAVTERRLRHWNDVAAEECPYIAMAAGAQVPEHETGRKPTWRLGVVFYIYARSVKDSAPSTVLNRLLDEVERVFDFDNTNQNSCTLGGLVLWCRIGEIETDEGLLGDIAVARVPVEMLALG